MKIDVFKSEVLSKFYHPKSDEDVVQFCKSDSIRQFSKVCESSDIYIDGQYKPIFTFDSMLNSSLLSECSYAFDVFYQGLYTLISEKNDNIFSNFNRSQEYPDLIKFLTNNKGLITRRTRNFFEEACFGKYGHNQVLAQYKETNETIKTKRIIQRKDLKLLNAPNFWNHFYTKIPFIKFQPIESFYFSSSSKIKLKFYENFNQMIIHLRLAGLNHAFYIVAMAKHDNESIKRHSMTRDNNLSNAKIYSEQLAKIRNDYNNRQPKEPTHNQKKGEKTYQLLFQLWQKEETNPLYENLSQPQKRKLFLNRVAQKFDIKRDSLRKHLIKIIPNSD